MDSKQEVMKKVFCSECGRELFTTDLDNDGAIGAECQQKGFVYKNACLYTNKYSSLYFCNHVCGKSFYQKHIPSIPEVDRMIQEAKRDVPRMSKEVSWRMALLTEKLKQHGFIK